MGQRGNGELPSDEELSLAIQASKDAGFCSSDLKQTDEGASEVRSRLPERFHVKSLDWTRRIQENFSKAGKEPGKRKRTPRENADAGIKRLLRAFPPAADHSEEYRRIHASEEFRGIVFRLRKDLDYRCQACSRYRCASDLQGHIVDYQKWQLPGHVLLLCLDCHPILDSLRRRGRDLDDKTAEETPLF